MTIEEQAMELSTAEKLKLMEVLWSDLSRDPEGFEAPQWHLDELKESERLIAEGKEHFLDWSEAKAMLRRK